MVGHAAEYTASIPPRISPNEFAGLTTASVPISRIEPWCTWMPGRSAAMSRHACVMASLTAHNTMRGPRVGSVGSTSESAVTPSAWHSGGTRRNQVSYPPNG